MRKFEAGKTYSCRSVCDYDCIFTFKIVSRTKKTVTIETGKSNMKRKIYDSINGHEMIYPLGRYSMNPILEA